MDRRRRPVPQARGRERRRPAGRLRHHAQGRAAGRIPIPEDLCTNLAFGGPDRKTLYVTAGKTVYKVPLAVSGYTLYPPARG